MAFTASDCFRLKLLRALETAGQNVLTYTLQCGTAGKSPTDSLIKYLENLPRSSTANFKNFSQKQKKHYFWETEIKHIESDKSCSKFDITLLYKAISVACEGWNKQTSKEVESLVAEIKKARNDKVHETLLNMSEKKFLEELMELHDIFIKTLEATKMKYRRDENECDRKKREVRQLIDDIRRENLGTEEILERSAREMLPHFTVEADKELREKHSKATHLDPLHFLRDHKHRRVEVQHIFSKIIISDEKDITETIHHLKLVTLTQNGPPSSPHLLMVEGDAGSGKTTLLTFMLSEWLREKPHRHMKGLHHFDLLLWVVCREESSHTLESLVQKVMPEAYSKYRDLLLPYLKQCRVLILIDGLDEQNDVSRLLVTDILSQGKNCPKFTLICTSRSEGVKSMMANTPKEYKICQTKIVGISVEERTKFVINHYKWLCNSAPGDDALLRQVMEQIGWKELFRLPLNLLFLALFFHNEPQKLTSTITQTELYQCIHDLCVEKLKHRLAGLQQPAVIALHYRIERVLSKFYEVAFQGLLQGNLYLSGNDLSKLIKSCQDENLPENEVLPAFYSLRRGDSHYKTIELYCAPHKGLQEFYAAHYILERLDKYKQGDIRRVLQRSTPEQDLHLESLRNMLCHLLGLLSLQEPMVKAMEETVDLIHESGVKKTEDWLSVLVDIKAGTEGADTMAHSYTITMKRVAHHIKSYHDDHDDHDDDDDDEVIYDEIFDFIVRNDEEECYTLVRDGTLQVATVLLPLIPHEHIDILLNREPEGVDALVNALDKHTVDSLYLIHHFKHPHPAAASAHLLQQITRDHLTSFVGHLDADHLPLLPRCLRDLYLVVSGNDHARSLLPALNSVLKTLPFLRNLLIHVPVAAVTPDYLSPLPICSFSLILILSGVGNVEVEAAWRIAAAMCDRFWGYLYIRFPGASLGAGGCRRMLKRLKLAGVKVRERVEVPDTIAITSNECSQLYTLAVKWLHCEFVSVPEEYLWPWPM